MSGLSADATLAEALRWWKEVQAQDDAALVGTGPGFLVRTALVTGITLLGLAFSYGRVQ